MIRVNDQDDGFRIAQHAKCRYNPRDDVVFASIGSYGECLGGAIFQDYTGVSVQVHLAGLYPNWATRDLIWMGFDYCFNQLGCTSIFGLVASFNDEALAVDTKLGFKEVTRIPDVFPDGDMIVLRLYKEDCRWLNIKPRHVRSNRVTSEGNGGS